MNNLIVLCGICLLAILLFIILLPKKNERTRVIKPRILIMALLVLGGIIFFCFFKMMDKITDGGMDAFVDDYTIIKAAINSGDSNQNDTGDLVISINLDRIVIDNKEYVSVQDAYDVIVKTLAKDRKIIIVDDYALATTYNDLVSLLENNGYKIEEEQEPQ